MGTDKKETPTVKAAAKTVENKYVDLLRKFPIDRQIKVSECFSAASVYVLPHGSGKLRHVHEAKKRSLPVNRCVHERFASRFR